MKRIISLIWVMLPFMSCLCYSRTDDAVQLMKEALNYTYGWDGCEKNLQKAFELYQKAADTGDGKALACLAECYRWGFYETVPVDESKAISYYKKSADHGNKDALETLRDMGVTYTPQAVKENHRQSIKDNPGIWKGIPEQHRTPELLEGCRSIARYYHDGNKTNVDNDEVSNIKGDVGNWIVRIYQDRIEVEKEGNSDIIEKREARTYNVGEKYDNCDTYSVKTDLIFFNLLEKFFIDPSHEMHKTELYISDDVSGYRKEYHLLDLIEL